MSYKVSVNNKSYTVNVISRRPGSIKLEINGKEYDVALEQSGATKQISKGTTKRSKKHTSGATSSSNEIKAPMPGIVAQVKVSAGDSVKKGDAVLVIEAMKMENNIPALRDGTISKVHVKEGSDVEKDQLLITFK